MAQNGHAVVTRRCPLLGGYRRHGGFMSVRSKNRAREVTSPTRGDPSYRFPKQDVAASGYAVPCLLQQTQHANAPRQEDRHRAYTVALM